MTESFRAQGLLLWVYLGPRAKVRSSRLASESGEGLLQGLKGVGPALGFRVIMENELETTIVYWGYIQGYWNRKWKLLLRV